MSYINANDILPKELINEIQKYVQGVNLYYTFLRFLIRKKQIVNTKKNC